MGSAKGTFAVERCSVSSPVLLLRLGQLLLSGCLLMFFCLCRKATMAATALRSAAFETAATTAGTRRGASLSLRLNTLGTTLLTGQTSAILSTQKLHSHLDKCNYVIYFFKVKYFMSFGDFFLLLLLQSGFLWFPLAAQPLS